MLPAPPNVFLMSSRVIYNIDSYHGHTSVAIKHIKTESDRIWISYWNGKWAKNPINGKILDSRSANDLIDYNMRNRIHQSQKVQ